MGNDKTKWIFDDDSAADEIEADFTESLTPAQVTHVPDDGPTRAVRGSAANPEKTELFVRGRLDPNAPPEGLSEQVDPVVGWLVVVKGPGLGNAVTLGPGVNPIGRDGEERAALPFGDMLLSSKDHARILYDDQERSFYIAHGSGKNITRVNGAIVASPVPLENFALIQLTNATHLRFVAFCNAEFDWSDIQGSGDAQS